MEVTTEIKEALDKLGYKDVIFTVNEVSFHRFSVYIKEALVGIYDIDRHTFVD